MSEPIIILIEPQMGENIGAAARTMANFGLHQLRIVNPRDGWPNPKAIDMAKHAAYILEDATLHDDFASAIDDIHQLYAATARKRNMVKPTITPRQYVATLQDNALRSAILFGPERSGLSNDYIDIADAILTIPVSPEYPSLNLAQSVNVIAYEYFVNQSAASILEPNTPSDIAPKGELHRFFDHLESALTASGFFHVSEKKATMIQNIRNMFSRAALTTQEVQSLHGIIRSLKKHQPPPPHSPS